MFFESIIAIDKIDDNTALLYYKNIFYNITMFLCNFVGFLRKNML